jgi:probable phosphoglycerate mutase
MIELYLIRHGECAGNRDDLFRGRFDFPLNETGIQQAEALRAELSTIQFKRVYTSPLLRCTQTAEILSENRVDVTLCENLTNITLGDWENTPKAEIRKRHPQLWRLWVTEPEKLQFPGMETLQQVRNRSFAAVTDIVESEQTGTIAIVTHRAVLKPLFAALLGIPEPYFWKIHVDNASYSIAEYTSRRGFTFTLINQNKHLTEYVREDLG